MSTENYFALEDRLVKARRELEATRARVAQFSAAHRDIRGKLTQAKEVLTKLKVQFKNLVQAPVTHINAFFETKRAIAEAEDQVDTYKSKVPARAQQVKQLAASIPDLERQIQVLEKEVASYGKVIQFPNVTARTPEEG